uniref:Salutaridine reductase n=1 Tax=Oryza brachyantha TaxID=4533 RepID=J3LZV1_ORYBR
MGVTRSAPATPPCDCQCRVAVVTGGNKGIGLEVCRQLAADGVTVVLTARDETRGTGATEKLRGMGLTSVVFHQLDITDSSSVARLADFLKARFGKLDILASSPSPLLGAVLCLQVNNAAVGGMDYAQGVDTNEEQFVGMEKMQRIEWLRQQGRETHKAAKNGVQTNYYGTKLVIQALLPLLVKSSSEGRIVNVSSGFGLLRVISNEDLKKELDDIDNLTEERLDEVLDNFLKDFEAGTLGAHGWPTDFAAYKMAKVAMNAYTRILARRHPALRVNCAHPGYVKTDMTLNSGFLTLEEGGRNIVTVALQPDGGTTSAYFDEGKEAPFM